MSDFNLVDRAMRMAMYNQARSRGYGAQPGTLSDWLGQWRDAYDMITGQPNPQEQAISNIGNQMRTLMADGKTTEAQALHQILMRNPSLMADPAFEQFATGAQLMDKLRQGKTYDVAPGHKIMDQQGNVLATNPEAEKIPNDVALSLFAAGVRPGQTPTDQQWADARKLASKHFNRQPTEFDELKASMTPDQWKQYLANKTLPPGAEHSTMFKLMQERDAAAAAGKSADADSYQKMIDALPKQSLLQTLLGGQGGDGNNPLPVPPPANPQGGGGSASNPQPSPGELAIRGQAIKSAVDQAISTKHPVTFVDPIDKSSHIITPANAQMILQNMQAASQPPQGQPQPTPAPTPPPAQTPTPQPQQ